MHQPQHRPSERFLLIHRLYTFFDEWGFYGVLLLLYFNDVHKNDPLTFGLVLGVGSLFIVISYFKMWYMEAMRFETKAEE